MCGIVGFVGELDAEEALPFLLHGLKRLEYRGYDSAGIALVTLDRVVVHKAEGKLSALEEGLGNLPECASCGIGHTRWATHGKPTHQNAHPHHDCSGTIAVAHNGIIENFQELKRELLAEGHRFLSETDSEVIPHLLEKYGGQEDLEAAVRKAEEKLHGAYAFLVVSSHEPDRIVAVRRASPLVVGLGQQRNYLASDVSAFLAETHQAMVLEDGDMAVLTPHHVRVTDSEGRLIERKIFTVDWNTEQAERGGYAHFMLKEMMEQPEVWNKCLLGRVEDGTVVLDALGLTLKTLQEVERLRIVAAGTAYHAGLVGKSLIERLARIPVEVEVASEFRYSHPILGPGTLVIAISQSGETADTLAGVRLAQKLGVPTYAITNTVGSTLAREADTVTYTHAGPEIAVASTKAYTTQLLLLTLFALALADAKGKGRPDLVRSLRQLPDLAYQLVDDMEPLVRNMAVSLAVHRDVFYIGRGMDYALAMEGQLKLKEISYIHAEAYAAGELKHGALALIEDGTPVVALATESTVEDKTISNILEVKARGAEVWAIVDPALSERVPADHIIALPTTDSFLFPALAALPLQFLAYWAAVERGEDVDQPRNLAKSVTVE